MAFSNAANRLWLPYHFGDDTPEILLRKNADGLSGRRIDPVMQQMDEGSKNSLEVHDVPGAANAQ
jgi:hypothetical protein